MAWSYQGQDLFVVEVLRGLRGGFFLDSGASDGTRGSNSRLLEESFGWRGICVEPNDAFFATLVRTRRATCVNACLSDASGAVDFVEAAGVYGGIADTMDAAMVAGLRAAMPDTADPDRPLPTVSKPAITIEALLDRAGAPPIIDYWSLDTEGSELRLLESFPFDRYRIRVLTVEHNLSPRRAAIRDILARHDFVHARDLGIDDGYVHRSVPVHAWRRRAWTR